MLKSTFPGPKTHNQIKQAFNQAIFEKILVYEDGRISLEFAEPFPIFIDLENSRICNDGFSQKDKSGEGDICSEQRKSPDQKCFLIRASARNF